MKHSISVYWRSRSSHYRLELTKCRACGRVSFFRRKVCPYCGSRDVEVVKAAGRGRVALATKSYFRVEGEEEYLPRWVALVELPEGARLLSEVVDAFDGVNSGDEVEAVLRRVSSDDPYGLIYYGLKFTKRVL